MRKYIFTLLFPMLLSAGTKAQQPVLSIYKYYGEKSKDSRSTTENIVINGSTVSYTAKFTGRGSAGEQGEEKSCTLTALQLAEINKMIADKKLNVNDSLIITPKTDEGIQLSSVISITYSEAGISTKVKCKGTPSDLQGKTLYDNAVSLYAYIKGIVNLCR